VGRGREGEALFRPSNWSAARVGKKAVAASSLVGSGSVVTEYICGERAAVLFQAIYIVIVLRNHIHST
jgi:hypothetical protein